MNKDKEEINNNEQNIEESEQENYQDQYDSTDAKEKLILQLIKFFICVVIAIVMYILDKSTNIVVLFAIIGIFALTNGIMQYVSDSTKDNKSVIVVLIILTIILSFILSCAMEFILCDSSNPDSLTSCYTNKMDSCFDVEYMLEGCE